MRPGRGDRLVLNESILFGRRTCLPNRSCINEASGGSLRVFMMDRPFHRKIHLNQLYRNLAVYSTARLLMHYDRSHYRLGLLVERSKIWSILVAMMKSFSCSPFIFFVCKPTVA